MDHCDIERECENNGMDKRIGQKIQDPRSKIQDPKIR
jgi:hypothetical protein